MKSKFINFGLLSVVIISVILNVIFFSAYTKSTEDSFTKQQLLALHSRVLHKVWIDKPAYVKDVLWESDEFLELDSVSKGDFGDIFTFKNYSEYYTYCDNLGICASIKHKCSEPDTLPSKAQPCK